MVMSTDNDLLEYQQDILDYGIDTFENEHGKARQDILRRLRAEWWVRANPNPKSKTRATTTLEMDETRLDETQFTRCAVYRVLSEYALPMLTKWNNEGEEDKFQVMMKHYREKYYEEFNAILMDGVRYDFDNDGTVEVNEEQPYHSRRLVR